MTNRDKGSFDRPSGSQTVENSWPVTMIVSIRGQRDQPKQEVKFILKIQGADLYVFLEKDHVRTNSTPEFIINLPGCEISILEVEELEKIEGDQQFLPNPIPTIYASQALKKFEVKVKVNDKGKRVFFINNVVTETAQAMY